MSEWQLLKSAVAAGIIGGLITGLILGLNSNESLAIRLGVVLAMGLFGCVCSVLVDLFGRYLDRFIW